MVHNHSNIDFVCHIKVGFLEVQIGPLTYRYGTCTACVADVSTQIEPVRSFVRIGNAITINNEIQEMFKQWNSTKCLS